MDIVQKNFIDDPAILINMINNAPVKMRYVCDFIQKSTIYDGTHFGT